MGNARFLKHLIVGLLLVSLTLAGCTGKSGGPGGKDIPPVTVTTSEDTGGIHGMVLDDLGLPVTGAQLVIRGLADFNMVESTEAGEFGFSNVPPGIHTIDVQRLGYQPGSGDVEVVVGQVAEVTIALEPIAVVEPHSKVFGPVAGRFFCASANTVLVGPCKIVGFGESHPAYPVEEAYQGASGGEANILVFHNDTGFPLPAEGDVLSGVVIEMQWESSQAASRFLWMEAEKVQYNDEDVPGRYEQRDDEVYGQIIGETPLRIVLTPEATAEGGTMDFPETEDFDGFMVGVFPTGDPATPAVFPGFPLIPSAYTAQDFEIWVTYFYNGAPEPTYTALAGQ